MKMWILFWKIILIASLTGASSECVSEYQRCQGILLGAVQYLQAGQIDTYCRESSIYIQCVEISLTECDPLIYNRTALLASTRETRDIYCPSDSQPGYGVCVSRLSACRDLSARADELEADTEYCSLMKQYVICVLRDISPCHQSAFNVTTLTLEIATTYQERCSEEGESCFTKYVECQRSYELLHRNFQNNAWDKYCTNSQKYLECISNLATSCGVIYTVTSSQSVDLVTEDRAIYCTLDGFSPSYHTCRERYGSCRALVYVTGDVTNTVVRLYCRSLDKYKGCISRDLGSCRHEGFTLSSLQTAANANWTRYCHGVDINRGNDFKRDVPRTIFTVLTLFVLSKVWHT